MMKPRPCFKWAGGKRRLLPQYHPHLPKKFKNYFEPFLGGGAMFFELWPTLVNHGRHAFLSDANMELMNAYDIIKNNVKGLIRELQSGRYVYDRETFEKVRSWDYWFLPRTRAAARFIYLNRTSFNGLYRLNSQGKFNAPFGRYVNPVICNVPVLQDAHDALQLADIGAWDYRRALTNIQTPKKGDFVYFDPPYVPISKTANFTAFTAEGFGYQDQIRLAEFANELRERGVKVAISNSSCRFVREIYPKSAWRHIRIYANRSINSNTKKRGKIIELLIVNWRRGDE